MQVTDQYNERWRSDWFTSDFWHILNFVFLCVLAFLWRPSACATRFAYSALEGMPLRQGLTLGIFCMYACLLAFWHSALHLWRATEGIFVLTLLALVWQ